MKELTYDWTSNKFDTVHTLRMWEGSKKIGTVSKCDSETLWACVKELESSGYTHKVH